MRNTKAINAVHTDCFHASIEVRQQKRDSKIYISKKGKQIEMREILIYVHGKGGSAEEVDHYKPHFPNCEVIGFDYRSQTPWEAKEEFPVFFAQQR